MPRRIVVVAVLLFAEHMAHGTVFTNTRPEIAQMAGSWEVDSVQISSLVTNQYPALGTNTWEYIFPHSNLAADGDVHIDMGLDASGTGSSGNNVGNSPIIAEVVNATSSQLSHLQSSPVKHSKTRGIFRFYTEHSSERHFEIHPVTELFTNNGPNSFGLDTNFRPNVTNVSDGATHPNSTLIGVFDGSDTMTTSVLADNNRVLISSPSPSVNYVQYAGVALSSVSTDSISPYFFFRPTLVPSATVRCRIVTNTPSATAAAGLFSNQTLSVNALTRTDMLVVSNRVASLGANQSVSFARPVELITLSIGGTGTVAMPPVISLVQATSLTETSATVLWSTDIASDSRAIYGLTPTTVTNVVSVGGSVTSHSVTVNGLVASTVYYYDVSSTSPGGTTTDDNQEQHYIFITPGPFDLPLTPANGLTSFGNPGGPFTPSNQVYSLSNTNGSSATWGVTKTALWLDVSPTNGVLGAGQSTNISFLITANANSQADGSYLDAVIFRNLTSGSLTTRVASLTVFPPPTLTVTPSLSFDSAGPPGGSFNPASQNYTLSNVGSNVLNWVVGKGANWLDLSATNGTLAAGASAVVTVFLNTNANSLAASAYSDTVTFTNTTNGIGNTTRGVNLYVSNFGFYDDFSTFTSGNLVGQLSWLQLSNVVSSPLQVSGGKVVIPAGQTGDQQDAYKDFGQTNITMYYGMTLSVSFAPTNTSAPQYFAGMYITTNASSGGSNFANYRFSAKAGDASNTNFVFVLRITGQGADPYTQGAGLTYGTQYRVIVQALAGGSNANVYLNPTSANLAAQTTYLTNFVGGGTPPPSVGGFTISQNTFVTPVSCGVSIGKAVVADNFTTVYNDLLGVLPPVASFTGNPTIGTEPLNVTFTDTSTGSITNRFWNFGDTSTTNLTTNVVAHTYAAGTYSVTLVASGPDGVSTNTQSNYINALTTFQAWQVRYFGSTSDPSAASTADPDGDGKNNLAEFLTGTDPTNSASAFHITSIVPEGNNLRITWTMGPDRTNAAQFSPGVSGSYATNFTDIFTVTNTVGTVTNYLDVGAATNTPAGYYRIRLVP